MKTKYGFQWLNINHDGKGKCLVRFKGRKYTLDKFEAPGGWIQYRGKELFVSGWTLAHTGDMIGLIKHPDDAWKAKVVTRKEVELL